MVECSTGELYTGCTTDVERRILEHNSGRGAKFTRGRRPVTLVYLEESGSMSEALRREKMIKMMSRREKLELLKRPRPRARRQDSLP